MTFLTASIVFILDRVTKMAIIGSMSYGESIKVIPGVFHITFVLNNGTAFGLLKGQNASLSVFSILAIIAISFYVIVKKKQGMVISLALGLILGGALGNLLDRIRLGHVIDFFDFRVWPVFNVADSCITIGIVLLLWNMLVKKK